MMRSVRFPQMTTAALQPRLRVLLIDDDDVIAGSLRQYLMMQGCDVHVAVDAESADAAMRAQEFDSIVVDPYLTGAIHSESEPLLGSIHALQPHAMTIVLTAYPSPELARAAAEYQPAAVLTKPQSVVYLGELVSGLPQLSLKGQSK